MALSVYTTYTALKDLANKDQRGFVSPDTFNSVAQPAQMMVFNDMFESVKRKRRVRQGQIDGGFHLSQVKRLKEDLSVFAKDLPIQFTNGVANKPEDFAYSISAETSAGLPVQILFDENKIPPPAILSDCTQGNPLESLMTVVSEPILKGVSL